MRLSMPLSSATSVLAASALALGAFALAPAASAAPAAPAAHAAFAGYTGSTADEQANQAFFDAVVRSVAEKRAAQPYSTSAVTVVYDASNAPSFSAEIARSAQIWNSSVSNVRLVQGYNADFAYYEGNDSRGSYASTDGHGRGYIFLDYRQNQQYDSTRVAAHETGHVLGLPDDYSGPCSELMSGGGPGPSCTNPYPDANERASVNRMWAYGFTAALDKALQKTAVTVR
ncbi:snapalysin [Streptomyces sp. MS06]|uniref:snapalysin n=1 Tax=Streptomyces sp. MS06 TaxID=3385974 RepID=UPI0039A37329